MPYKLYRSLIILLSVIHSHQVLSEPLPHSDSPVFRTEPTCSQQSDQFFFLAPYSARTDPSQEGGTVEEVASDGFTALGLSYHTNKNYVVDVNAWLNTDLCLIYRLSPKRTVTDKLSNKYFGPVGTLIRVNNNNGLGCLSNNPINTELNPPYICEEIGSASDQQMDTWVAQVEQLIIEAINDPLLNSRIVAWYLMPEEMNLNVPRENELLQRLYHAVMTHDPLQRPAWVYNSNSTRTEQFVNLSPWVDIFSMGIYPNLAGHTHQRIQVRHALTQMTTANESLRYPKRIIPVMEMFESSDHPIDAKDSLLIRSFVRHDAYSAFANGADGLLIFSMGFRDGFESYSTYYQAWAQVAGELNNLSIRDVIQNGALLNEASAQVTNGEAIITFKWPNISENYPSLSLRDWHHNNKDYILIVNSSEGNVAFTLNNITSGHFRDIFSDETIDASNGYVKLSLPALGVLFLESAPSFSITDGFSTTNKTITQLSDSSGHYL